MIKEEKSVAKQLKLTNYFLGFICSFIFVYILIALKQILIPVIIAIFLTYLFHPLLVFMYNKYKIPKWVTLILLLIFNLLVYYLLGLVIASNLNTFTQRMDFYTESLYKSLTSILSTFNLTLQEFIEFFNIDLANLSVNSVLQQLVNTGIIQSFFTAVSSLLGDSFIAMFFWVFMILGKSKFEERLKLAFSGKVDVVEKNLHSINSQLQSYIVIKTILSLITGAIATVILTIYGIDFAIFWGILTFVLNYIPNIGSLIATIFPILIALLEYGFGFTSLSLAALLVINQNIVGNVIEPHFLGRRMDLSPVFVLFSLIFWGWIWGIVGMFLAVPIAALMKILFNNIEALKPISVLIGSKAELTGSRKIN